MSTGFCLFTDAAVESARGCYSMRPLYVFEKTVATFGTFALLYTVTESFIIPLTPTPEQTVWRSLLDLSLPFLVAFLLLFYLIFGALIRRELSHPCLTLLLMHRMHLQWFCGAIIVSRSAKLDRCHIRCLR